MSKEDADLLDDHIAQLMEFFDSVQILASKCDNTGTSSTFRGAGNHYARMGMARELLTNDAADCHHIRAPKPPPDEDDEWKK